MDMKDSIYVMNKFEEYFPQFVDNGNISINEELILALFDAILDLQEQNLEKDFQIKKLFDKIKA